ncbi:Pre-mRNA-splicing factor syf2 [Hypsibius exemplaris]|uniref:Pre-mRNA-splicing factor SYF2 n=1 Tax=Hypsibius exemplaris TaxID=2072580 RepID=A0A1W0WGN3_HYPEX|nr:Pre-mRNA-splicing factor syf2 [Hypsibius exemplaris]
MDTGEDHREPGTSTGEEATTTTAEVDSTTASSSSQSTAAKALHAQRMKKLRELHAKRNEARNLNHRDVVEEDHQRKLPKNWEARRERMEWKVNDDEKRKEAEEQGYDYDRLKVLEVSAAEASSRDMRKRKKQNPDLGFSTFEDSSIRQYTSLTKQIKPDFEQYEKQKAELGDRFYATANTIMQGEHKDSPEAIEKLVGDVNAQADRRQKFSRRRTFNAESEIDFINEKNMHFNKKLSRFYGKYTSETKQNIERGTAV